MAALTEEQKERCRYFLGYLGVSNAPSMQLGIPRPLQTVFLLEDALSLLTNQYSVQRVTCILETLEALEKKMAASTTYLAADRVGSLQLHPLRNQGKLYTDSLEKEVLRWSKRLADVLGVPPYAYSSRFRKSGPGSGVPVG